MKPIYRISVVRVDEANIPVQIPGITIYYYPLDKERQYRVAPVEWIKINKCKSCEVVEYSVFINKKTIGMQNCYKCFHSQKPIFAA